LKGCLARVRAAFLFKRKKMKNIVIIGMLLFLAAGCGQSKQNKVGEEDKSAGSLSDEQLLDSVQYRYFQYFWDGAEPNSGMARERFHADGVYPQNDKHIVTTGGSGFGLMAILVGIERGFISRQQGFERFQQIVDFLEKADRFHGVWPHWLDGETGKVKPFSKNDDGGDTVETSFLIQGMLAVMEYFKDGNTEEQQLAEKINQLWREVEWNWYTRGENALYWHWSPNVGWEMNHKITGYNECLITYILAAPHPLIPLSPKFTTKAGRKTAIFQLKTPPGGIRCG
jgi:hypothetical protein